MQVMKFCERFPPEKGEMLSLCCKIPEDFSNRSSTWYLHSSHCITRETASIPMQCCLALCRLRTLIPSKSFQDLCNADKFPVTCLYLCIYVCMAWWYKQETHIPLLKKHAYLQQNCQWSLARAVAWKPARWMRWHCWQKLKADSRESVVNCKRS